MDSAVGLRGDYDGTSLRRLARASKSANQARRLLALAEIYDGASRTASARIGGNKYPVSRSIGRKLDIYDTLSVDRLSAKSYQSMRRRESIKHSKTKKSISSGCR